MTPPPGNTEPLELAERRIALLEERGRIQMRLPGALPASEGWELIRAWRMLGRGNPPVFLYQRALNDARRVLSEFEGGARFEDAR